MARWKRNQPTAPPRRDHNTSRELPAWYYRIVRIIKREGRDIQPYDFDEDISELGEGEGDSDSDDLGVTCDCDLEDECECYLLDDDTKSEHSYTGPDASCYYLLKGQRMDRKIDLRDAKQESEESRVSTREFERHKEQEVDAACAALLDAQGEGDCPGSLLESIAGKTFELYSVHHVDHCYNDFMYGSKYVEFYYHNDDGESCKPPDREAEILGHVYMNTNSGCDFLPFRPSSRASCQTRELKAEGLGHPPTFQFISDKYLIMTVTAKSDMISNDIRKSEAAQMPDVFKFVGIHRDLEERRRQKREEMEEQRSRRSPSPNDSFFNTDHRMGAWNWGPR